MSNLSAHVLDTRWGVPAAGVELHLSTASGEHLASGTTDADGRIRDLGPRNIATNNTVACFRSTR